MLVDQPDTAWASPDTERRIIGAILLNNSVIPAVRDEVAPSEFTVPILGRFFAAALALHDKSERVEAISLAIAAGGDRDRQIQDLAFDLTNECATSVAATTHGRIVRGFARKRQLRNLGAECMQLAADVEWDAADDAFERSSDRILASASKESDGEWVTLNAAAHDALQQVQHRYEIVQSGVAPTWKATLGTESLDDLAGGYEDGHFHVTGARSGHGKTAFAVWSTSKAGEQSGRKTYYLTMEVDTRDTVFRLLADKATVDSRKIREGRLTHGEIDRLHMGIGRMASTDHMVLCYKPGATVEWLSQSLRRLKRSGANMGVVVVDYLQKLRTKERFFNDIMRMKYIAETLKDLAGMLEVPVLGLAQLNRDYKQRQDKRPIASDIRGGDDLLNETSALAFIHRPEMCGDERPIVKGLAEFVLAKGRNVGPGIVPLEFQPEFGRFKDWTGCEYE